MRGILYILQLLRIRGVASILSRLPQYIRLSYRLLADGRVPFKLKLYVILAILYGFLPFDLIPEALIPPIGIWDDIILIILTARNLIVNSPTEIVTEHAREISQGKKS